MFVYIRSTAFVIVVTPKLVLLRSKYVTAKCTETLSPPPSIQYLLGYNDRSYLSIYTALVKRNHSVSMVLPLLERLKNWPLVYLHMVFKFPKNWSERKHTFHTELS